MPKAILKVPAGLPAFGERERKLAKLIWRSKPMSRFELHQHTGIHPTLTGNAIAVLVNAGLLRDGQPQASSDRGRPRVPVEIDPDKRVFLGLSIAPGEVRCATIRPTGSLVGRETVRRVARPDRLIAAAAEMLGDRVDKTVFGIGVTVTGVVDPAERTLLLSSALRSTVPVSVEPIYKAAGRTPITLNNDMHALALRWLLDSGVTKADLLLVGLDDGRFGASILFGGRPLEGSVTSANELGHNRFPVDTAACYCGQPGCLERIFSTDQLQRIGVRGRGLDEVLAAPGTDTKKLGIVLDHLANGLANAINFIRPAKLVIVSPLARHATLTAGIESRLPPLLLAGLRSRVQLSFWQQPSVQSGENAAWLALAEVFGESDAR